MIISSTIERSASGWHVQTVAEWGGRRFITNKGASTFKFAVFEAMAQEIATPKGKMTAQEAVAWLKRQFKPDFHYCIDNAFRKAIGR